MAEYVGRDELLDALRNDYDVPKLPNKRRDYRIIYETGDWSRGVRGTGHFHVDYASFAHGTSKEVQFSLIQELEREGVIEPAFPENPKINAWKLKRIPNSHTADCLSQAADHIKEAIALLLCSNADDIEPDVDVLRPIARRLEAKAKP